MHETWLFDGLVTTTEAAGLASQDIGRLFTRRQVAIYAGKVCKSWPRECRREIGPRQTALTARQWERADRDVRRILQEKNFATVTDAGQVARWLKGRYAVSIVHVTLSAMSISVPMRRDKPYFNREMT